MCPDEDDDYFFGDPVDDTLEIERTVIAFLERRDRTGPAGIRGCPCPIGYADAVLICGGRLFATARRVGGRGFVTVPGGVTDPDDRVIREIVWFQAEDRGARVRMNNAFLARQLARLQADRPPR